MPWLQKNPRTPGMFRSVEQRNFGHGTWRLSCFDPQRLNIHVEVASLEDLGYLLTPTNHFSFMEDHTSFKLPVWLSVSCTLLRTPGFCVMVLSFGHSTHHVPICWSRHVKTGSAGSQHVACRFRGEEISRCWWESESDLPLDHGSAFSKAF